MRNIYLYGALAEKYGASFRLDVRTAGEAIRALAANFPEITQEIREGSWHVVRGEEPDKGMSLDETDVSSLNLGSGDLHILPYVAGSKRGGALKVILGGVLIGAAFLATGGALASVIGGSSMIGSLGITGTQVAFWGAAIALSGISSMLTPEEESDEGSSESFSTSGPGSTTTQGVPVPLVYGEAIVGGALVSGGIDIERIAVTGNGGGSIGGGNKK